MLVAKRVKFRKYRNWVNAANRRHLLFYRLLGCDLNLSPKVRHKTFRGISMYRHSQEEKHRVVALYQQGYGSTTISNQTGISLSYVKRLINRYLHFGMSGLAKRSYSHFTPEFWVQQVKTHGYSSLSAIKLRGRPPKDMRRAKERVREIAWITLL